MERGERMKDGDLRDLAPLESLFIKVEILKME